MKKLLFITALICLCACSKDFDQVPERIGEMNSESCETHKIDKAKALEIASLYFNQTKTRSVASLKMEYIIDNTMTRSNSSDTDTLAYILNRGTEDGFVIVSSDNRVYPILAHSETGTFEYETGDIVDVQFISRLSAYFEENKNSAPKNVIAEDLLSCATSYPALTTSWSQGSPWDKYVIQEHPGCPAGCAAVAAGMIMSHCKFSHVYHGITFEFARIIAGLDTREYPWSPTSRIVGGPDGMTPRPEVEPYSRDVALDYAARLLYWIGKDINMNYPLAELKD